MGEPPDAVVVAEFEAYPDPTALMAALKHVLGTNHRVAAAIGRKQGFVRDALAGRYSKPGKGKQRS